MLSDGADQKHVLSYDNVSVIYRPDDRVIEIDDKPLFLLLLCRQTSLYYQFFNGSAYISDAVIASLISYKMLNKTFGNGIVQQRPISACSSCRIARFMLCTTLADILIKQWEKALLQSFRLTF